MADTQTTLVVLDGENPPVEQNILVITDGSGNIGYQMTLRYAGALVGAANPLPVASAPNALTPVAGAQYSLAITSATTLTVPGTATLAHINVQGNSMRYTTDGTTPTSSEGMGPYGPGTDLWFSLTSLSVLQFIQTAAGAVLNVEYYL